MLKKIKRVLHKSGLWHRDNELDGRIIVTGSGRAGTTCLMHLFTALGLDTGFSLDTIGEFVNDNAKAGLELDIRSPDAPHICKSPWFSEYAAEALSTVNISHVIIPVRDFHEAAESRIRVTKNHQNLTGTTNAVGIQGGLVFTENPDDQLMILQETFIKLIRTLADFHVPVTFLGFPRFARDPQYLYEKLGFLLGKITYADFLYAYQTVIRPEFIHTFAKEPG